MPLDRGPLEALTLGLHFDLHGVPATVTRPEPNESPIETRVIWVNLLTEDAPLNVAFARREPRRILAVQRSAVPTVPRGTIVVAPEKADADPVGWRFDGVDRVEADHYRLIVVRDSTADPYVEPEEDAS